jgi:hypothetical protein
VLSFWFYGVLAAEKTVKSCVRAFRNGFSVKI